MKNQRSKGFIFSLVIVVAAVLFVLPTAFRAQAAYTNGYLTYTVENGEATITDCDTSISGSFTIPSKLGSYPVTSIGNDAFEKCTGLTSITIPSSVKWIGPYAFYGCSGLTSVTIPKGVTSIGNASFKGCTNLTNITIPNSVIDIDEEAFHNTAWYNSQPYGDVYAGKVYYKYKGTMPNDTKVVIKNGTKCIVESAFEDCTGLTSITIPNSVTSIGNDAFLGCTGLTSVTIPSSVKWIDPYAFWGCTGLTSITIPSSVKWIGPYAFYGCTGLTSVTIPNSVTSIDYNAFEDCTGLTSIAIYSKVCDIYDSSYTFPSTAKIIGLSGSTAEAYAKKYNRTFEVHKHIFSSWKVTKVATCTKAGNQSRTCSVCKKKESKKLSALGHSYKITKIKAKATLSKNGSAVTKCKRCGLTSSKTVIYKIKTVKLSASSFVYNGKAKTPTVTVKDSKGRTLKKNTDYTVKYSSGRKNIGTYTVTVTFKGNYSGQKSLKFKIVLGQVFGISQMNKKGINFTWNKVAGATGYEVYFYDVSGKRYVKLAATKTTKLGNSGAKGKMTIKIRAFKKVGNKMHYGSFSKPVTFRAK